MIHVLRSRVPYRLVRLREHARETLWVTPVAGLILACLLWNLALTADQELVTILASDGISVRDFTEDAKAIVTAVSQAMLTFLAVVFSLSLVALQMTSGQLTPRVVRIFVRNRITKLTLTVFLSTFVFSLLVLTSYNDPDAPAPVPLVQSSFTLLLVGLSLVLFIAYVTTTLRLMQVGPVVDHITREALRVMERSAVSSRSSHSPPGRDASTTSATSPLQSSSARCAVSQPTSSLPPPATFTTGNRP
ncbi:DUF2254 family protein [Streptomyces sp. NPDC048270]|uniref:DUF2254 family protein n=1 Tax=Streptomyces sp. NPDC048270 TaxID=3154615 RepID=UPI0033F8D698